MWRGRVVVATCTGRGEALSHAAHVAAVARVDLDNLTLVDKQRHTHGGAGLDGGGLEGIGLRDRCR